MTKLRPLGKLAYLVVTRDGAEGLIDLVPAVDLGHGQGELSDLLGIEKRIERIEGGVVRVAMNGEGFRKGQYGPFLVGEVGRLSPGGQGMKSYFGFAQVDGVFVMHIQAIPAAVDLGNPVLHEYQQFVVKRGFFEIKLCLHHPIHQTFPYLL